MKDLKSLKSQYNLQDLEIYHLNHTSYRVSFSANKLKQSDLSQASGYSIRLIKDKKVGFVSSYGNNPIEELIAKAIANTKYSAETNLELPKKIALSVENKAANKENDYLEIFQKQGNEIVSTISKELPNVLIDISFDFTKNNEEIKNSNDLNLSHESEIISSSISIRETKEDDFIEIFAGAVDTKLPNCSVLSKDLIRLYKFAQKNAKAKNGQFPILFTAKAAKELYGMIESALNGKLIIENSSPWSNKLGEKVLSDKITIKQDPRFGYMAKDFDDEGIATKEITLIENGVLKNFYFDLKTAGKSNGKFSSTGNGFKASLSSQPEPHLLNMILPKGKKKFYELIKNIDYGILVDQTMGGLSMNISGDMSVNLDLGYLIEKGEVVGRLKDTMINGNIYNVLNNVIDFSNESHWLYSNIYNSDVLVDGFTVTA